MRLTIARIPASHRLGLAKIKTLSPDTVGAVAEALEGVQASDFAKLTSVVEGTAQVNSEEATSIVASLRSLYLLKATAESSLVEFVAMLMAAMQRTGGSVALAEADKQGFADKLTRLLSLSSLGRSTKIDQLKMDYASILEDAKILTDLRPVFDKPGERPVGAIVTHTLKIVSHEADGHKELYFALDGDDLLMLKRIIERALDKMSSLKDFIKSTDIKDLS